MKKIITKKNKLIPVFILFICLVAASKEKAAAQIIAWDAAGIQNGGPPQFAPDTIDQHVVVGELTRSKSLSSTHAGVNGAWGAQGFSTSATSEAMAISLSNYVTFTVTPLVNCTVSLTSINPCSVYKSDAGSPTTGRWQYSTDNVTFNNIGSADITWGPNTGATSNLQTSIDLTGISALQHVGAGTTITFRIVTWGATSNISEWGFGIVNTFTNGIQLNLTTTGPRSPVIAQWSLDSTYLNDTKAKPTYADSNLTIASLGDMTEGPGLSPTNFQNNNGYWAVNGFTTAPISLASNAYFQAQITVPTGATLSLSAIDINVYSNVNADDSPGMKTQWAYSLSGAVTAPLTLIGSPDTTRLSGDWNDPGYVCPTVNCSGVTDLQNIPAGTTVTLRYFVQPVKDNPYGGFTLTYYTNYLFPTPYAHRGITLRGIVVRGCNSTAGTVSAVRDTICQGTSGNLILAGNSSNTIQWQSSATQGNFTNESGKDTTRYKTPPLLQSTYYRVIVGGSNCADTSGSFRLFVPPALVATFNYSASGSTLTFNSDSSTGTIVTYHWDFGDGSTSTEKNPTHTYAKTDTTYYVCLTLYDGSNCSYTFCKYASITTGVSTIAGNAGWVIYPNPFTSGIVINGKGLNKTIRTVELYDVLGRAMLNKIIDEKSTNLLLLDVSMFANGIYFLHIITDQNDYMQKVIKQ